MQLLQYTLDERDRRWNRARAFMAANELDALIVHGEHEDAGPAPVAYDTWFTNGRPGTTVVLPANGDPVVLLPAPMFIMDHLESTRRGVDMWVTPEALRVSRTSSALCDVLSELGLSTARIGTVGLGAHMPWNPEGIMPYGTWSAVLERFRSADFRAVDLAFGQMVLELGPEEIEVLRRAARIGDAMVEAMVNTAAAGVPENEVYAAGMGEGFRQGGFPPAMHLWAGHDVIATGPPAWSYRPEAPRVLRDGDIIYAEVFSTFGGRQTQSQVTITVGDVHEDFHRAAEVTRRSYDAGLAALRAGATFGSVVDAMHGPLDAAGGWPFLIAAHTLNPGLAVGKGRGLFRQLHGASGYPDVSDHPTFLGDLVLQPGMSFALEPNYGFHRHLAHLGGTAVVTEDEPLELNPYSAQLLPAAGRAR